MASLSYLESEARRISQSSDNPTVAKLAEIVMQLCDMCKDMEEKIKKAHDEARRASRAAKK